MKRRIFIYILFIFLFSGNVFTQPTDSLPTLMQKIFRSMEEMPIDTFYYPFYNDVQMIEIDHLWYWNRRIDFLESIKPRAMAYSMLYPPPIGNELLFRNKQGVVIKAFNTDKSLEELTEYFKNIPIERNLPTKTYPHTNNTLKMLDLNYHGNYLPYSKYSKYSKHSKYYLVSSKYVKYSFDEENYNNKNENEDIKYGMIDSFGNIVIPIEYNKIIPFYENLLVLKDKWGIIDYNQKELVPLQFDRFTFEHNNQKDNIFFLLSKAGSIYSDKFTYNAVFISDENKLKTLNSFDYVAKEYIYMSNVDEKNPKTIVNKDGKIGILNAQYEEILAPQYDIFEYGYAQSQKYFRVAKNGKFGFFNKDIKEVIPLQYDYAEAFNKDSIALVLKDDKFFCINTRGKKIDTCNLTPIWIKKKDTYFFADNYTPVYINPSFFGVIDENTSKLVLPIQYKFMTAVGLNDFCNRKQNIFQQKKIKFDIETKNHYQDAIMNHEMFFYNNKIIVKNSNNKYGVIDTSFNVLIDFKYDTLQLTENLKYLIYSLNNKIGLMDNSGKNLLKTKYDDIRYVEMYESQRYLFQVKQNEKWGIINFDNKVLVPCEYDSIKHLSYHNRPLRKLWIVEKDNKFGVVDDENKIVIPIQHHNILYIDSNNDCLLVEDENKKISKIKM